MYQNTSSPQSISLTVDNTGGMGLGKTQVMKREGGGEEVKTAGATLGRNCLYSLTYFFCIFFQCFLSPPKQVFPLISLLKSVPIPPRLIPLHLCAVSPRSSEKAAPTRSCNPRPRSRPSAVGPRLTERGERGWKEGCWWLEGSVAGEF